MNEFGIYLREAREDADRYAIAFGLPRRSLRWLAGEVGLEPSYLSKIERGLAPPPSEAKICAIAKALEEDPDVLLALAGKVSSDLLEAIRKRPELFAEIIRLLKDMPDEAVVRVVREVRDGEWWRPPWRAKGDRMLELRQDQLKFTFLDVHPRALLTLSFQRTLRIPDDDRSYPLPPGLGQFPLRHVDDFAANLPGDWLKRGGVMLPMWQAEAMWLSLRAGHDSERGVDYPFAIKVAAGKRSAVTGKAWQNGLNREPQDYLVAPKQPWLDGFCVEKGLIRQFVAMPLGQGYSVEEQLDGKAEFGGLQLEVFPMKRAAFERRFPVRPVDLNAMFRGMPVPSAPMMPSAAAPGMAMGLAAGGKMRQEISVDPYDADDWDLEHGQRCFVHLCNSALWQQITGAAPPTLPPSAADYSRAGLPWFEYYSDAPAVEGGKLLAAIKSVFQLGKEKGQTPLPENAPAVPKVVVGLEPRKGDQVRTGEF